MCWGASNVLCGNNQGAAGVKLKIYIMVYWQNKIKTKIFNPSLKTSSNVCTTKNTFSSNKKFKFTELWSFQPLRDRYDRYNWAIVFYSFSQKTWNLNPIRAVKSRGWSKLKRVHVNTAQLGEECGGGARWWRGIGKQTRSYSKIWNYILKTY